MRHRSACAVAFVSLCAGSAAAHAAEVLPGGALDITISGFNDFYAAYGRLNRKNNLVNGGFSKNLRKFDFLADAEVHILARGHHDATGIDYGGTIYLNASTCEYAQPTDSKSPSKSLTACEGRNSREEWLFLRGGFGEFRLGDTDSAANNMKIGAYTVAVGTGGIDGKIVDVAQDVLVDFSTRSPDPAKSTLYATKAVYYSPIFSGFQLGLSFTPTIDSDSGALGDDLANTSLERGDAGVTNEITSGLSYAGLLGPAALRTSLVGATTVGRAFTTYVIYGGAALDVSNFQLGGGVGTRRVDGTYTSDHHRQTRPFYNLGASYRWDPVTFSVNYGWAQADEGQETIEHGRFSDLVFGVELGLLPGLTLSSEAAYFSLKPLQGELAAHKDNDNWVGVTRLRLVF